MDSMTAWARWMDRRIAARQVREDRIAQADARDLALFLARNAKLINRGRIDRT